MTVSDLHWINFSSRGGHAQAGRRPAIILQSAASSARLPTVLVVPLTTQLYALRFPETVLIQANRENGLRHSSVALAFQLTATDKQFVGQRLGKLSVSALEVIWQAFDEITACTQKHQKRVIKYLTY